MAEKPTDRKQAEDALKESRAYLRALIRTMPDPVWLKDPQGIFLFCNSRFESLYGADEKDIIGKTDYDFVDKETADSFREHDALAIATGKPSINEEEITFSSDGHREILETIKTPIYGSNGQLAGVLGIGRDITERKRSESERLSNLDFFEKLDKVNRAMQGTSDLEQMMRDALDAVLSVFGCDRAFLAVPCDPAMPEFRISMERTSPAYPGAFSRGIAVPMSQAVKDLFTELLRTPGPNEIYCGNGLDPGDEPWKTYEVKSQLAIALYPKVGKPWECGLHQCSHARVWTSQEKILFQEISRRLADGLTSLLMYRDMQQHKEFLDNIFENLPNMVFVKDAEDLRFIRINKAGEHLLGYPREELLEKNDYDFFPKEEADFFAAKDREVLGTKRLLEIPEETIRTRTVGARTLHTKKIPILDETGTPKFLLGISEDITERKKNAFELNETKERLQSFLDSATDAMTVWDSRLNLIEINNSALEFFLEGMKKDDLIGKNMKELLGHIDANQVSERFIQVLKTGIPHISEELVTFHPNNQRWLINKIFKVGDGLGVITNDVTEKKKLEEQLRHAQKIESIGRLAGGVAHDFNNMLGIIIGQTELAQGNVTSGLPLSENLHEIRKAAERSADLTRQLLAFARKQVVAPKVLDLNETLAGMLRMLRTLIGEHIDLVWNPAERVWPIRMDPSQVDQILANLCVNSRDAIADVGQITIETKNVTFDEDHCAYRPELFPGDFVMMAVSDDGSGMDKETVDKIFEPFFTTKGLGKGTGLGLATVYGIVKQNDGFINVYSEPGFGSTFKIYLPRHTARTEQVRHETILLVEDMPEILAMVSLMLERTGYRVMAVPTPGEALRVAGEYGGEIHLLISDVIMPGMNGRILAEKITSLHPEIKRLFMSGYTDNVIAHHGVLNEGVHFIQKPFSIKSLAAKVREALGNT
jgi:two-component system cell cycle sensor histidine kinase/response regulator CckA